MEVSKLMGTNSSIESISYTPRGIKPIGTCVNSETGKKFVIFELPEKTSRVSNFLERLESYKSAHHLSKIKKNPFSLDSLGFLAMLGINIENEQEALAFAIGAYSYRMLESKNASRSFSEALYILESSKRDEVREKNIRVITGARSNESRAKHIANVIRLMSSKGISFNIQKLVEDLLYRDSKNLSNSWINEFYGSTVNNEEE